MENQENKLRRVLNENGYTLGKKASGYRIGDKVTNTVYLGEKYNATLEEVATFVANIDEGGFADLSPYKDGRESGISENYTDSLEMELANLIRHRETLILQGKRSQAAELDEKIKELEEELEDEDEDIRQEQKIRHFLNQRGYVIERGIEGYQVRDSEGAVCLGVRYDAMIDDLEDFSEKLGMV